MKSFPYFVCQLLNPRSLEGGGGGGREGQIELNDFENVNVFFSEDHISLQIMRKSVDFYIDKYCSVTFNM